MCEVELGLQVQLDGDVLHACKQKNVTVVSTRPDSTPPPIKHTKARPCCHGDAVVFAAHVPDLEINSGTSLKERR